MKIDYYSKPKESLEFLLDRYSLDTVVNIEELLNNPAVFKIVYQNLIDILKWGFEIEEIRKRPIHYTFKKDSNKIYEMEIRHFISNMILWRAFMDMDSPELVNEEFVFDFTKFNINDIAKYIDDKILPYHMGDFASKNKTIDEICYHITAISNAFCLLIGMSISIYDIIQAEKRIPEISDILFGEIDPTLQSVEIEEELNKRTKRLIELFSKDKVYNSFKPLFLSGKNLSEGQFKEMLVKIGFKSDINGNTIPILIDANLFITGLKKPSYVYINGLSGRKALILTKNAISTPGAFSKKLNHVTTSASYLRHDYEVCDSAHYIEYEIKNDKFLLLLNGRYYYDTDGTVKQLDYQKDKHLIGKIVPFKSPCTCNSKEGICKECYGHLFDINRDMFSVGALSATKNSEPMGQTVLSSKHQQITHSGRISFDENFDKLFELSSSEIIMSDNTDVDGSDLFIVFDQVFVEESDDEEFYYVKSFNVIDANGEVLYHIEEENDANMYLSKNMVALYKSLKDKTKPINLEDIDPEDALFTVEIKNKELTEPIKIMKKILNSKNHYGATNISGLCQVFVESLMDIGISYDLVHAECIIRALIRKKSNILEFPDWSKNADPNDWQILTIDDALFDNPSVIVSISTNYLRKKLLSTSLYQKTAPSHLDPLCVVHLSDYI